MSETQTAKRNNVILFLTLIRWPNLVILILVQVLVYLYIEETSLWFFIAVAMMTTCATAAGYIINDLYDQETDRLNGRRNVFAGKQLDATKGWTLYGQFCLLGGLMTIYLCTIATGHFLWIFAMITILLWSYSRWFKGLPVIGNLVVSFLCAVAVLLVCLREWDPAGIPQTVWWLSGFAFTVTWIRELVKDLEDMDGDSGAGLLTLPVIAGDRITKAVVTILSVAVIFALTIHPLLPGMGQVLKWIFWIATVLLIGWSGVVGISFAKSTQAYHRLSTLIKISMLTGTLTILI